MNGLKEFIQDDVLISHYKYFEYEFLRRAMKFAGLSMIKNDWIDLQENFIMQNNFGGDIYDVAKKLNLSFNVSDLTSNAQFQVKNCIYIKHYIFIKQLLSEISQNVSLRRLRYNSSSFKSSSSAYIVLYTSP